jgi:hypothetical protein
MMRLFECGVPKLEAKSMSWILIDTQMESHFHQILKLRIFPKEHRLDALMSLLTAVFVLSAIAVVDSESFKRVPGL